MVFDENTQKMIKIIISKVLNLNTVYHDILEIRYPRVESACLFTKQNKKMDETKA